MSLACSFSPQSGRLEILVGAGPVSLSLYQPSVVAVAQLLSRVLLFATPWTAAHLASQSFSISWSLLKLMSIVSDAI